MWNIGWEYRWMRGMWCCGVGLMSREFCRLSQGEITFGLSVASYTTVKLITPIRGAVIFLLLGGGMGFAQAPGLPVTSPTSNGLGVAVPVAMVTKTGRPTHRAEVVLSASGLQVTADNSSLNQILREIARLTGMKITGGVSDERVFGQYGPASMVNVLTSLLDGTGSNVFLKETASDAPIELILTPRNGGPTPPNPNAPGFDDGPTEQQIYEQEHPRAVAPTAPLLPPGPAPLPFSAPVPTPAVTSTQLTPVTPGPGGITDAPTVAPATEPGTTPGPGFNSTGETPSPNGVKTPQQIYEELQKLQQQQPPPK
jgi:hypothetical protein